ncbi:hypothetical protein ACH4GM_38805 [Streptomyces coeruleorubidus]|uniref:hypothetical protein n=1 Tax=Streptomyces coeruleorubidus TaxID=116188 RepID=UPI0037B355BC
MDASWISALKARHSDEAVGVAARLNVDGSAPEPLALDGITVGRRLHRLPTQDDEESP